MILFILSGLYLLTQSKYERWFFHLAGHRQLSLKPFQLMASCLDSISHIILFKVDDTILFVAMCDLRFKARVDPLCVFSSVIFKFTSGASPADYFEISIADQPFRFTYLQIMCPLFFQF